VVEVIVANVLARVPVFRTWATVVATSVPRVFANVPVLNRFPCAVVVRVPKVLAKVPRVRGTLTERVVAIKLPSVLAKVPTPEGRVMWDVVVESRAARVLVNVALFAGGMTSYTVWRTLLPSLIRIRLIVFSVPVSSRIRI
jgi:hypothetical protein